MMNIILSTNPYFISLAKAKITDLCRPKDGLWCEVGLTSPYLALFWQQFQHVSVHNFLVYDGIFVLLRKWITPSSYFNEIIVFTPAIATVHHLCPARSGTPTWRCFCPIRCLLCPSLYYLCSLSLAALSLLTIPRTTASAHYPSLHYIAHYPSLYCLCSLSLAPLSLLTIPH